MKYFLTFFLLISALAIDGQKQCRWDFQHIDGWVYEHQDTASVSGCEVRKGKLLITTRGGTYDRQKMHTREKTFRNGTYKWRTFIPKIRPYDQVSIGSWIYCDDRHEMDFEVGYGTREARKKCGAKKNELLACMTNQALPYVSKYVPIKPGWHEFCIKLELVNGCYLVRWIIDGKQKNEQQLEFGREIGFHIYCSVENLRFLGEQVPDQNYCGKYDWVTYEEP